MLRKELIGRKKWEEKGRRENMRKMEGRKAG